MNSAAASAGIYRTLFGLELQRIVFYRVDFWTRTVYCAARVAVAYFLWLSIFAATKRTEFAGMSFEQMMVYYVVAAFTGNVVVSSPGFISQEIYQGTITKYLLYPASLLGMKFSVGLAPSAVSAAQLVAAFIITALVVHAPISAMNIVLGLIAIFAARGVCFFMFAALELFAFWVDQVFNLWLMAYFLLHILGGMMVPPALFPAWFQTINDLTPFPYLIAFPTRIFCGSVGLAEWLSGMSILALWAVLTGVIARILLRRGIRNYSGVGM